MFCSKSKYKLGGHRYLLGRLVSKLSFFYKLLDLLIPKNKNQVCFYSIPNFTDNSRAYYDYLAQSKAGEYQLVWLFDDVIYLKHFKPPVRKSYYFHSFHGVWKLLRSKYIVWNHSKYLKNYVFGSRHVILQLWHGMPIKTIGYTENGTSKDLTKSYGFFGRYAHFFVTSDLFAHLYNSTFRADWNRIHITGEAKTDCCFHNNDKLVDLLDLKSYDKVVLYMPTYKEARRFGNSDVSHEFNNFFYFDDFDLEHFENFLSENKCLFIVKPHPFDELAYISFFKDHQFSPSVKLLLNLDLTTNDCQINQLFPLVNTLITDFSSTSINFLITKKPMIYLTNLEADYGLHRGFMLPDNSDLLMYGSKVKTYAEFIDELSKWKTHSDPNPHESILHKYYDGESCARIYKIMKEL